jgi:hypothetical protein
MIVQRAPESPADHHLWVIEHLLDGVEALVQERIVEESFPSRQTEE